ncbi:thiamine phosphate synthase [Novosphingobium terrae]|uniref:thiamine phosphate synthase n=1 Tax=Novosphingobium terrae TaxID=2726189 RepID=UPI0019810DBA|nr:thiamine phosphate synthase [Novosphingobium terrae]
MADETFEDDFENPFDSGILPDETSFGDEIDPELRPRTKIYLISPLDVTGDFPERLRRVIEAGVKNKHGVAAFQFRVKGLDEHAAAALAAPLQAICAEREVAFIVNDSISLAKRLGADGVHLGQDDGDPREARDRLGPDAQIGVSCNNSRHLAMNAGEAGADYVAFGAFFPTKTKVTEHVAQLSTLACWQTVFEIPCVAIGGITPENCGPLVRAGADFLAVSSAIWDGDEVANVQALIAAIHAA